MFQLMRNLMPAVPAMAILAGWLGQPILLGMASATLFGLIFAQDWTIRRQIGAGAWPSDGFARHVLTEDLGRLAGLSLAGLPLYGAASWGRALTGF